jgi:hypothetical protein
MPQCSSTCGARLRRPRLSRGFAARPGIGSILARSCGPEMSALAPLLGDKQTFGERVRNDAIDPTRKRSVHRSSYRRVLDTAPLPLVLRQRAIMMLAMSWRDWTRQGLFGRRSTSTSCAVKLRSAFPVLARVRM